MTGEGRKQGPGRARRLIYLLLLLSVMAPMIFRISFKEHPSPMVRDVFETVEELEAGARVLFVLDFDPATEAEIMPMARAFLRHLCLRQTTLYCLTLWPTGPIEIDRVIDDVLRPEYASYDYGRDYVNLGFSAGYEGVIVVAMSDLKKAFPTDAYNNSTHDADLLPVMAEIEGLWDVDLIIDCSSGYPGPNEWIQYAAVPGDIPIVAGISANSGPELFPFMPEPLLGMLLGLKGAAEYEQILLEHYPQLDRPECRWALKRMGPQTVAHVLIIILIVFGNLRHERIRRRERQ